MHGVPKKMIINQTNYYISVIANVTGGIGIWALNCHRENSYGGGTAMPCWRSMLSECPLCFRGIFNRAWTPRTCFLFQQRRRRTTQTSVGTKCSWAMWVRLIHLNSKSPLRANKSTTALMWICFWFFVFFISIFCSFKRLQLFPTSSLPEHDLEEEAVVDNFLCVLHPTHRLNCSWSFTDLETDAQLVVSIRYVLTPNDWMHRFGVCL